MPARLDRITVAFNRGELILTWDTRQALMARMQYTGGTEHLRDAFDAVGASRPVELGPNQRDALLQVLEDWASHRDDYDAIPIELIDLRDALIDHFDETEQRG